MLEWLLKQGADIHLYNGKDEPPADIVDGKGRADLQDLI